MPIMNQLKISMVQVSLVGFVHVAPLKQGEFCAHKKGAANRRHPSESIFQPSDIFLRFVFWGGRSSKISNKQMERF